MLAEIGTGQIHEVLKSFFGFEGFKGNQEKIIQNVLNGKDTFVLT